MHPAMGDKGSAVSRCRLVVANMDNQILSNHYDTASFSLSQNGYRSKHSEDADLGGVHAEYAEKYGF